MLVFVVVGVVIGLAFPQVHRAVGTAARGLLALWNPLAFDNPTKPSPLLPTTPFEARAHALTALKRRVEAHEQQFPVVDGASKHIEFATTPPTRTPLCVVYVHGWSACRQELSPVPERVAASLGANLFCARLRGHGLVLDHTPRHGEALAKVEPAHLFEDAVEAVDLGLLLGEKVVLLGCSFGGVLMSWLACKERYQGRVHAVLLMSPAFRPFIPMYPVLKWVCVVLRAVPGGNSVASLLFHHLVGPEKTTPQPFSEAYGKYWTHRYPITAVLSILEVFFHMDAVHLGSLNVPTLMVANPQDHVIDYGMVLQRFGEVRCSRKTFVSLPADHGHVLSGRILSPGTIDECVQLLANFVKGCK